ncbi:4725_t:CDS:2, partial [Ambispora leptoticha]
ISTPDPSSFTSTLPELIEIKKKYKYRIILDESLSFGVLGKRGAGLTDYFNIKSSDVDMIVGSMCNALCSSGGFCSGSHEITDYQRISGPAYCFSAALPAMLAVSASESLAFLSQNPQLLVRLQENSHVFRNMFKDMNNYVRLDGSTDSPVMHLRLNKKILDLTEDHEDNIINSNHRYNYHGRRHSNKLNGSSDDSEKADRLLQEIVDKAIDNGILLTRAKYVRNQEHFDIEPSIRICISASFTKKEIENIAITLKNVITNVLRNKTHEIPSATIVYTNGAK